MSDKTTSKGWFKSALSKLNRVMSEDMSEYDEDAYCKMIMILE